MAAREGKGGYSVIMVAALAPFLIAVVLLAVSACQGPAGVAQ